MLSVHGLSFRYPGAVRNAVDRFGFDFEAGHVYGIFGRNGSGKSTLLQLLAGDLAAEAGTVELDGRELRQFPRRERARKLAAAGQDAAIPLPFTVRDSVMLGRYPWKSFFRPFGTPADQEIVRTAMELTGIDFAADRLLEELSGGERQRAMLARIIAQDTPYLLLDEPASHLDLEHRLGLYRLLRQLAKQRRCVLLVCHDLLLSFPFIDTALVLRDGELCAAGPPETVFTSELLRDAFNCDLAIRQHENGLSYQFAFEPK